MLLHKLEHVGIRGTPLNLFKIYHTNRNQYVHVNDVDSSMRNLTSRISFRTPPFPHLYE